MNCGDDERCVGDGVCEEIERDSDSDGLMDQEEQALETDPSNPDTDFDGLEDGVEVHETLSDPLDADTDDDGLGDGEEVLDWATDPLTPDTDGGGIPDGMEIASGTDPTNPDDDRSDAGVEDAGFSEDAGTDVDSDAGAPLDVADVDEPDVGDSRGDGGSVDTGLVDGAEPIEDFERPDGSHQAAEDEAGREASGSAYGCSVKPTDEQTTGYGPWALLLLTGYLSRCSRRRYKVMPSLRGPN